MFFEFVDITYYRHLSLTKKVEAIFVLQISLSPTHRGSYKTFSTESDHCNQIEEYNTLKEGVGSRGK